ncbi:MAG TPA: hypothetical protein VL128_11655 [Candidatus Eisenbacteria bacterium]|nr:hypothetical protein [Candidatus Eisenbacteria bacterium]
MEFLHEFFEWVVAVFEHWEGYVFGGVVGVGLELFKRFRDWEPNKKVFSVIVSIGFLFSIFSAWKDQRESAQKYQHEFEQLAVPQFELVPGTLLVTTTTLHFVENDKSESEEKYTLVLLPMTIFNRGAQSVIRGWNLDIRMTNGNELKGSARVPQVPEIDFKGPDGHSIRINSAESLFIKGSANPIAMGGGGSWLCFVFATPRSTDLYYCNRNDLHVSFF